MKLALALCVLFVASVCANGPKQCFQCSDCKDQVGTPQTCSSDKDVCMKIEVGDHIVRRCSDESLCGIGKIERAANRVWADIVSGFKDVDKEAELVYCCDDELCNGALNGMPSIAVLLLPVAIAAFFKY